MDDVLPKPFTRKSLLDMLEKHLSHLKKLPPGMEPPPSATASSVQQSSAALSLKDDATSPAPSPAGSIGNWQSPVQYSGVSPIHTNIPGQYTTLPNHSPYETSPHTPLTTPRPGQQPDSSQGQPPPPPQQQQQHRRQLSDVSGGAPEMAGYKRQRLYGQQTQGIGMQGGPQ